MLTRLNPQANLKLAATNAVRNASRHTHRLPEELRQEAERLFGMDLSDVRVVLSMEARKIGVRAFTSGSHICLDPSEHVPNSERWMHLLMHEVAHVVQQRRGQAHNPYGYGIVVLRDPALEAEAKQMSLALKQRLESHVQPTIQLMEKMNEEARDEKITLRPRDELSRRGEATALGIRLVADHLKTLNQKLKVLLKAEAPPVGYGVPMVETSWDESVYECLSQFRDLEKDLEFHLDMEKLTSRGEYTAEELSRRKSNQIETIKDVIRKSEVYDLLDGNNQAQGRISLAGLVNRYSSALFSDHHGLLLLAKMHEKSPLVIYSQSFDATSQFSGSTSVRSDGNMPIFTGANLHGYSMRNAVGFSEQYLKLSSGATINVHIFAEVGLKQAKALLMLSGLLDEKVNWTWLSSNEHDEKSGVNDITIVYNSSLASEYDFSIKKYLIGNAALVASSARNGNSECKLLGCHILNSMATNQDVSKAMNDYGISALFGDTNISTQADKSLKVGFRTVESNISVTDGFHFKYSNSASDKMYDKLLIRT